MKTKRITSIVLTICMLMSMLVFPAHAAGECLTASKTSLKPGDTFTLKYVIPNSVSGVDAITIEIGFDKDKFEATGINYSDIAPLIRDTNHTVAQANANGKFRGEWSSNDDTFETATTATNLQLFEANFTVKETATAGDADFTVDILEVFDEVASDLSSSAGATKAKATVNIIAVLSGDYPISITAPVKGAAPQTTITEDTGYAGTISWSPTVSGSFAGDTVYTATVELTAKSGYQFASTATASVFGATISEKTVEPDGSKLKFKAAFPATAGADALGGTVSITGTAKFGETLTANTTSLNYGSESAGTLSYQWYRGTTAISGATSSTYTLAAADVGQTITVQVKNSKNSGSVTSTATDAVAKADGPVAPSGLAEVSKTDTTITVTQNSAWEYSKNNGSTWQASNTFTGLTPNTAYSQIVARVKETATHKASAACSAISVTTAKATADSTLKNTLKNAVTAYNAPYDGTAHNAFTVGSLPSGWSAQYADSESGSYSATMPKVTNVSDSKTLWVKFSNSSYSDFVTSYSVSVTAKNISGATITLNDAPTYNGSEQTITINKVEVGSTPLTTDDYDITSGNKATNVGNTTLKITGKGNYTGTASTTWSLKKATPTVADFTIPTLTAKDYTGSPITVSAPTLKSGKTGAGTITVKYGSSATAPTNAGSYTVTFDVAAGTNYNAATGLSIGTLIITAKNASDLTVSAPDQTTVVGVGTFNDPVVTFNGTTVEGTYKYAYDSETNKSHAEVVEMLKTKSKDAEVTLTGTFTPNSTNFTGTKTFTLKVTVKDIEFKMGSEAASAANAITELTADTVYGKTWNQRISLKSGIVASVGSETKAGTYTIVPGAGALTDRPDAGTASYTVQFTSTDGTYTNVTVFTGTITVTKKDVTITGLKASDKVYNGNTTATATGTAAISGMVQGDTVTVTAGTAAFADKKVGNGKTVSFTGYTLSGADASNYNLPDQPASVTANITAKPVTVTVTATNRDYVSGNRNVVLVAGSVTGIIGGDTVNVDVSGATGTMENEDAGTGKAVTVTGVALSGSDAGNYRLTGQPTGITVNITRATYGAGPALSQKVRATGEAQNIEVDVSTHFGAIKGAAVSAAAKGTDTNSIISSVTTEGNKVKFSVANTAVAGNTATINITISCTNFQDITSVLTVEMIDKEVAGVSISGAPAEAKTYGDADFVLTATAAVPGENGVWTWESSNTSILTVTGDGNRATVKIVGTGTGTTIKATYVSDTSAGERNTAAIRVNPGTITVAAKNQSIYVNGTAPDLTSPVKDTHYTVTGLAAGETLGGTISMKYQKDGVDATPDVTKTGTYDIVISGATAPAGGNYNDVVFTAGTLTIANRPSSGGGGYTPTITVPVSDPKNQVKVTVTVSGTTATVQKIDLSKIDQAQGVTIDFIGLGKTIESAKLPTSAIKEIGATESGALTVKLTAGSVTFDNAALKAVADQAGSQITLTLTPAKTSTLNASQKETVGDAPVFDLQLLSGSKAITDFKGGNVTVTLPHTLSKGQEPAGVVVYYLSNDGNPEACKTTYDAKSKLVTFTTTHFSLYFVGYKQPTAEWENPFTDVAEGAWYYDSIKYVYSNGMMVGTGDTKFSPDTTTTRGMIVTILYRLEGEPAVSGTSSFNDVASGRWYANAVKWAAENEIVGGYGNGNFGPEDPISREQMAAILYRYAAFKGFDMTKTADLSKFTDSGKISDWAKAALSWANAEGLINGKGGGILDPLGNATRAEVSAILYRFCENVVK